MRPAETGSQLGERVDRGVARAPIELAAGAPGVHHGQRHEQFEQAGLDGREGSAGSSGALRATPTTRSTRASSSKAATTA
jgi:hypothetical protein